MDYVGKKVQYFRSFSPSEFHWFRVGHHTDSAVAKNRWRTDCERRARAFLYHLQFLFLDLNLGDSRVLVRYNEVLVVQLKQ